jgi:hypothetical protein
MNASFRRLLGTMVLLGMAVFSSARSGLSQTPPAETAKADAEQVIREQSIYIPYEKLRQVFEKQGRGVFLPYEKFQELWQAAREKTRPAAEAKPPVGALISEIDNEATVEKDVVRVQARLKIEVLSEGWNEISLRLADAAITGATIGQQPARIVGSAGQDYRLLVEKKGKQPEQIELFLQYAKAITRTPGLNSVSLQAPQAPVSRWRITIPQAGVKVNIQPLIAATEVPAPKQADGGEKKGPEETVVLAFVGAAPQVRIDWTPKAEGATGLAALASVQAEQQVSVNEGVVRTRTALAYTISRAELGQLVIEVPGDQKVVNVFDANVRQWSVAPSDGRQRITAQLFEPAKGSQQVTVELEKLVGDQPRFTLHVPVVKAVDVGRQQGVVVVAVAEGLQAEALPSGELMRVDAADLPGSLARGAWTFSYRYAAVPFELKLEVQKVQPRILADSLVEAYVEPERISLDVAAIYTVERAGVFRLELDIPAGFDVRKVYGRQIAGAAGVQVDAHHLEGENQTRLVVNLARKAIGRVALLVELQKALDGGQRDLLAQPGKATDILLPIPTVAGAAGTLEQADGRLLIYATQSLLLDPGKPENGLRGISVEKALAGMQSIRDQKPAEVRPVWAYAYTAKPAALKLSAQRRMPKLTIQQLLVARIESGVVKYHATFAYEVLFSGVKSLRIDVPADMPPKLSIEPKGLEKKPLAPQPDDVSVGDVAWEVAGKSELLGSGKIEFLWDQPLEKLEIGKSVDLKMPHLRPRKVDRAWGQVALTKAETLDLHEVGKPENLTPIDPQQDLSAPVPGAARAFEFSDDWKLTVKVTQYALQEVKRTNIERAVVRMVVTPAHEVSVQALYRIRSAQQRLLVEIPGEVAFDTAPVRLLGRPVPLERGGAGQYYVPLVSTTADEPFLLELRYTVPFREGRLDLPAFPPESAVLKVYLCTYLPADWALLGTRGPWTEEFRWRLKPSLQWELVPRPGENGAPIDDQYLVSWVREGVKLAEDPAENFQTDGTRYLYSALRPAAAPAGSLGVKTMHKNLLHAAIFLLVVLGGILLLPTAAPGRALAVGVLITVLVLVGVFCPTCSVQILDSVLAAAVFIVLVLWVVWYFARTRPRLAAAPQVVTAQLAPEDKPAPQSGEGGQSNA